MERNAHDHGITGRETAAILLAAVIMILQADKSYDEAVQISQFTATRPADESRVVVARILTVEIPGARALLQQNGDCYE